MEQEEMDRHSSQSLRAPYCMAELAITHLKWLSSWLIQQRGQFSQIGTEIYAHDRQPLLISFHLKGSNLQSNTTAEEYHTKHFGFETFISIPFIIRQPENTMLMLMYSWPFSPSSWTHFLFHNNTIHNDQALLSCEWVFQNLKRWGKPDASPKGTYGHKWTRRQVE